MSAVLSRVQNHTVDRSVSPLVVVLSQLNELLGNVSDDQYSMKPVGVIPSSLGGHVRHCLDHVKAWLAGFHSNTADYDHRQRGTTIETKRLAARDELANLIARLERLGRCDVDRTMYVRLLRDADSPAIMLESTLGRELAFVVNHTIHHNALIGVMARLLDIALPDRFGYAPSTLAYMERMQCVR